MKLQNKKLGYICLFASVLFTTNSYAQTCDANIKATTPSSSFSIINNGGEVKDNRTGLIWQRCSLGQVWNGTTCKGDPTMHTWIDAIENAQLFNRGYRLPNVRELKSLVEFKCEKAAINLDIFPNTPSRGFWSSSPSSYQKHHAWIINFNQGTSYNYTKKSPNAVRAVRSE